HIGVPFMLSTMPRETQFGVFEMGMNHAGEITPLTKMVKPDIAIITTVGAVHMEFFDSVQKIADAKAEIFAGLGKGGIAVLNADNDYFDYLKGRAEHYNVAEVYSFGEDKNADACLENHTVKDGVAHVSADIMGKTITFTLNSIGKHIALNAMAVLLSVELAGLDVRKAARSLEGIAPLEGRGAKTKLDNGVTLIDESYNASPIAVKATIEAFSKVKADRHILCLGDMLELGGQSDALHQSLANPIVEQNMSLLYCCGPHMKALYDVLPADRRGAHYENSAEMAKEIKKMLKSGDAVLVKGSLGSKMKMVVEAIKA
ncbi:MAG TPA: UDP-N-acetylmuramoylalanyl-D-glutamyl-2, 6-diaminopimelate--D-alanyl-D-alanine ligase, partial [Rhodospirillaceae bacterium]|nr:UDP-N-acetylmuramoylalanyl-D-glutamyl-2, 6-diaminopimelate--D-alanyl-D-alanine ligase [Rhodospirillaceae bacterium]